MRGKKINVSTHPPSFLFPVFSALSFWKSYYRISGLLSWISKFLSDFSSLLHLSLSYFLGDLITFPTYLLILSFLLSHVSLLTAFSYICPFLMALETFHGSDTSSYPPEASVAVAVPSPTPWSSQSLLLPTDSPYPPRSENLFLATLWPFLT